MNAPSIVFASVKRQEGEAPNFVVRPRRQHGRGVVIAVTPGGRHDRYVSAKVGEMSTGKVTVNGLELPGHLVDLLDRGRWTCPKDHAVLDGVFRYADPSDCRFYSLDDMSRETAVMKGDSAYSGSRPHEVAALPDAFPGDIDFARAVCIGDIGIDAPICLDYRRSPLNPSVVVLYVRWEEVAPDFQTLAHALEL